MSTANSTREVLLRCRGCQSLLQRSLPHLRKHPLPLRNNQASRAQLSKPCPHRSRRSHRLAACTARAASTRRAAASSSTRRPSCSCLRCSPMPRCARRGSSSNRARPERSAIAARAAPSRTRSLRRSARAASRWATLPTAARIQTRQAEQAADTAAAVQTAEPFRVGLELCSRFAFIDSFALKTYRFANLGAFANPDLFLCWAQK